MKITNNYAFAQENRVGQQSRMVETPLVEAKTASGEPVVKLCDPDSYDQRRHYTPRRDGSAIVSRDAEGAWKPVATIQQLQETIAATPKEKLGEQVGIWTDSGSFLSLKGKDGIPQDSEVQSFQSHWDSQAETTTQRFKDLGVRTSNPKEEPFGMTVGWAFADAQVRPSEVEVVPASFPGKTVGVLQEPLVVVSQEVLRVDEATQDRFGSMEPTVLESIKHTPGGTEVTLDSQVSCRLNEKLDALPVTDWVFAK